MVFNEQNHLAPIFSCFSVSDSSEPEAMQSNSRPEFLMELANSRAGGSEMTPYLCTETLSNLEKQLIQRPNSSGKYV